MMGTTHGVCAAAAGILTAQVYCHIIPSQQPLIPLVVFCVGAILGGYIPDMDTPNSHISRSYPLLTFPYRFLQWILGVLSHIPGPFQSKLIKCRKICGHRNLLHMPEVWCIFYALMCLISILYDVAHHSFHEIEQYVLFFFVTMFLGTITHLFLDSISGGIPFLSNGGKRVVVAKYKTNGVIDILLSGIFALLDLFLFYVYFQNFL